MNYRILHVEDSKQDADLVKRLLTKDGLEFTYCLVEDEKTYRKELLEFKPDVILCDHTLPGFDSRKAFDIYCESQRDIPFILVTGTVSEEFAVDMLKKGVDDYLLKTNLKRLPQAIKSEVTKRQNERMLQSMHTALERSEMHLRTIFETSALGFILMDAETNILELNSLTNILCKRAFGYELQKHKTIITQLPQFRREAFKKHFVEVLLGKKVNYESEYAQVDGSAIFFNVNLSPVLAAEGGVLGGLLIMEDITEKKKLELERLKLNEHFRLLASNMTDMVALHDIDGRFRYVSPSCEKITGYTPEEMFGTDPYSYVHPDDLAIAAKGHEISKKTELIPRVPFRFRRKDGSYLWIETNALPLRDPLTKQLVGLQSSSRDITERVKSERERLKANELFKFLAENMSDMVALHAPDGVFTFVSVSSEKILGYKAEELIGISPYSLMHPHDIESVQQKHQATLLSATFIAEYRLRHKDGSYVWVESSATPILDNNGEVKQIQSITRDITERKKASNALEESEKEFRLLANSMPQIVWATRPDGWNIYFNKQWPEYTGLTLEESYGDGWIKPFHPEDQPRAWEAWKNAVQYRTEYSLECRLRKYDGSYHWWLVRGVPQVNEAGEIVKWYGTCTDIETLKQGTKELSDYKHALDVSAIISITDGQGFIQYVNDYFCEVTKFSREEVRGKTHKLINSGFHTKEYFAGMWQTIREGKVWRNEIKNRAKDGTYFWTDATIVPFLDEQGKPVQFVALRYDISERKRTEEALATTAQHLQQVLTSNPDIFYVIDPNYKITLINETAKKTLSLVWQKNVVLGEDIRTLIPVDTGEPILESFEKVLQGQPVEYEVATPVHDEERWFFVSYTPVLDKEIAGKISSAYVVTKDITSRKKAELALRHSEQFSNNILSSISSHIAVVAADGAISRVNKAWNDFSKANGAPDLSRTGVGSNYLKVCQAAAGEEEIAEQVLIGFKKVINQALPFFEIEYACHSPKVQRWFLLRISRFVDDPPQVVVMHIDITERKKAEEAVARSEEKYKMLFRNNPMPMWVAEAETSQFLAVNKAAVLHYGFTEAEFLKLTEADLRPDSFKTDRSKSYQDDLNSLNTSGTLQHKTRDGNLLHVEVFAYPIIFEGKLSRLVLSHDITQRVKAEEQVLRSQQQFKGLIENISGVYWVINTDLSKPLYISPSYETIWGRKCEDFYKDASDFMKVVNAEDLPMIYEAYENAINRPYQELEYRISDPDGNTHWIAAKMKLITDPRGYKIQYGYAEDVTEEKLSEQELMRSQKQFQNLVENISGIYWTIDLTTYQTLYISPSYEALWGQTIEGLYADSREWAEVIHPEDKERVVSQYADPSETGRKTSEYRIIRKDGDLRWFVANMNVVLNEEGHRIQYGYAEDITERKNAEERLKTSEEKYKLLFKRNPLPMWVLDSDTLGFLAVNEAALLHYGFSEEEFLKLSALDIRREQEKPVFLNQPQTKHDSLYYGGVWKHLKKNKEEIDVEIYAYPFVYEGRAAKLTLANDVTEKIKAERLLEKSYADIQRLVSHLQKVREEERKLIAREIHDELGQQLTVMKMDISWLQAKLGSADAVVEKRLEDLLRLMDDNIQSVRKIAFDLRPSMLDDVGLRSTIEWYADEFQKRTGIMVNVVSKSELEVPSDMATNIYRVFQEGLTNVARHSGATKVNVGLELKEEHIFITISDNGKGFNVKAKNDKTLGLLGMRERTAIMHGTFQIESKPGKGTTIVVSVPVLETEKNYQHDQGINS